MPQLSPRGLQAPGDIYGTGLGGSLIGADLYTFTNIRLHGVIKWSLYTHVSEMYMLGNLCLKILKKL